MRRRRRATGAALALGATLLVASCGGGGASAGSTATLRVFAAASLREAFTELARGFEVAHDDVEVDLTFAGSSGLAAQIVQGAPADVFVAADEASMRPVLDDIGGSAPVVIARNRLAVVVEPGNPTSIRSLADLARPDVVLVLCAPAVPCGRLARSLLEDVEVAPASLEEHVTAVVSKVALGEADAGVAYATDVRAGGVEEVEGLVPDDPALQAVYPMTVLDDAPRSLAAAWIDHVRSPAGVAVLERLGFLAP